MTVAACPRCPVQTRQVVKHCPSSTCNWIKCEACGGFGLTDGSRWAERAK